MSERVPLPPSRPEKTSFTLNLHQAEEEIAKCWDEIRLQRTRCASLLAELERQRPVIEAARALCRAWKAASEDDDWEDDPFATLAHKFLTAVDALDGAPGEATA